LGFLVWWCITINQTGERVPIKQQTLSPRVVRDLKKRSFVGIFFYTIAILVVLFADGYYYRHPSFSNLFLIMVNGICLFRLVQFLADSRVPARFERLNTALLISGVAMTALIWGLGFAVFMAQQGEEHIKLLMVVCTVGLCSGGSTAYTPYLWLALGFNCLIMGPVMVFMVVNGLNIPLVILFVLFSTYMVIMSTRANTEYRTALENEALLEEKTRDLEKISHVDGLTGLYNRRYFDTAFDIEWQRAIRHKSRLVLVLCDIDYFKRVNDAFGHLAGDEYLRTLSKVLLQVFKRQTDIVARYGGEEFVALMQADLSADSLDKATDLAETFRHKMENTRLGFESNSIKATVSIGVSEIAPRPGQKKESLIAQADTMLYKAKEKGRNQVAVHPF